MNSNKVLEHAIDTTPPIMPLHKMVGVNPLADLESRDFQQILSDPTLINISYDDLAQYLVTVGSDKLLSATFQVLPDARTQEAALIVKIVQAIAQNKNARAKISMLSKKQHFFTIAERIERQLNYNVVNKILACFASLIVGQKNLHTISLYAKWKAEYSNLNKTWRLLLQDAPSTAQAARDYFAEQLSLQDKESYCAEIIQQYPGWFGFVKFNSVQKNHYDDLLAIWLAHESLHLKLLSQPQAAKVKKAQQLPQGYVALMDLDAWAQSLGLQDDISSNLSLNAQQLKIIMLQALELQRNHSNQVSLQQCQQTTRAYHQDGVWIFCLDPRSANMRSKIEEHLQEKTYGAAGFFNLPLVLHQDGVVDNFYPVASNYTLDKNCNLSFAKRLKKYLQRLLNKHRLIMNSSFVYYELFGWLYFLGALIKSYHAPRQQHYTIPSIQLNEEANTDVAQNIAVLLHSIDLTEITQKNIYIVGHESQVDNNHHESMLQCAACGAHTGYYNALELCRLLNNPKMRAKLASLAINIASTSQFVPVVHDTNTDSLMQITQDFGAAHNNTKLKQKIRHINRIKLSNDLPFINKKYSKLWSRLIPEWGLSNHSGLLIGNYNLNPACFKNNDVFMHSYNYQYDVDGTILSNILEGPGVIAANLNLQYYFSSVNKSKYGSGDKTRHTIIPQVGVMENDSWELKFGLPQQSFSYRNHPTHIPTRLQIYLQAPAAIVQQAISKTNRFNKLFNNNWVSLYIINNDGHVAQVKKPL